MGINDGKKSEQFDYRVDDVKNWTLSHLYQIVDMESVCIFADSRGKHLAISNVETKSFPGIKIITLLEKVETFLNGNDPSNYKIIYIFAEISDLTSRQRSHDSEE